MGAFSGENRCSGTYATIEKSMLFNLTKGMRCRGVECGGGNICVINCIVTIHELNMR